MTLVNISDTGETTYGDSSSFLLVSDGSDPDPEPTVRIASSNPQTNNEIEMELAASQSESGSGSQEYPDEYYGPDGPPADPVEEESTGPDTHIVYSSSDGYTGTALDSYAYNSETNKSFGTGGTIASTTFTSDFTATDDYDGSGGDTLSSEIGDPQSDNFELFDSGSSYNYFSDSTLTENVVGWTQTGAGGKTGAITVETSANSGTDLFSQSNEAWSYSDTDSDGGIATGNGHDSITELNALSNRDSHDTTTISYTGGDHPTITVSAHGTSGTSLNIDSDGSANSNYNLGDAESPTGDFVVSSASESYTTDLTSSSNLAWTEDVTLTTTGGATEVDENGEAGETTPEETSITGTSSESGNSTFNLDATTDASSTYSDRFTDDDPSSFDDVSYIDFGPAVTTLNTTGNSHTVFNHGASSNYHNLTTFSDDSWSGTVDEINNSNFLVDTTGNSTSALTYDAGDLVSGHGISHMESGVSNSHIWSSAYFNITINKSMSSGDESTDTTDADVGTNYAATAIYDGDATSAAHIEQNSSTTHVENVITTTTGYPEDYGDDSDPLFTTYSVVSNSMLLINRNSSLIYDGTSSLGADGNYTNDHHEIENGTSTSDLTHNGTVNSSSTNNFDDGTSKQTNFANAYAATTATAFLLFRELNRSESSTGTTATLDNTETETNTDSLTQTGSEITDSIDSTGTTTPTATEQWDETETNYIAYQRTWTLTPDGTLITTEGESTEPLQYNQSSGTTSPQQTATPTTQTAATTAATEETLAVEVKRVIDKSGLPTLGANNFFFDDGRKYKGYEYEDQEKLKERAIWKQKKIQTPGFDCDDYADAGWHALKRHFGDSATVEFLAIHWFNEHKFFPTEMSEEINYGHAVLRVKKDGETILVDPQTGVVVGVKDGLRKILHQGGIQSFYHADDNDAKFESTKWRSRGFASPDSFYKSSYDVDGKDRPYKITKAFYDALKKGGFPCPHCGHPIN